MAKQIFLVRPVVVVVKEERDDAGRRGAHEQVFRLRAPRRRPSGSSMSIFTASRSRTADRRVAARHLPAGAPAIAVHLLMQPGIVHQVGIRRRLALAAEAVQAVLDVGRVARLRHLAVVDDVDAGGGRLADDVGHGVANARGERVAARRACPPPSRTSCESDLPDAAGCPYGSSGNGRGCVAWRQQSIIGGSTCAFRTSHRRTSHHRTTPRPLMVGVAQG